MDTDTFLLKDYEVNTALIPSYSTMRLAAIGGALGVLGVLVGVAQAAVDAVAVATALVLVLCIAYATLRIVASMNRNLYARCLHLALVEEALGQVGFYRSWCEFVARHPRSASSHGLLVALRVLNLVSVGYTLAWSYVWMSGQDSSAALHTLATLAAMVLAGCNERFIQREFSDPTFLSKLRSRLIVARLKVRDGGLAKLADVPEPTPKEAVSL